MIFRKYRDLAERQGSGWSRKRVGGEGGEVDYVVMDLGFGDNESVDTTPTCSGNERTSDLLTRAYNATCSIGDDQMVEDWRGTYVLPLLHSALAATRKPCLSGAG